ncbi:MAG: hypothetical protein U1F25_05035 [Rubrivivax sp.]
MSPAPARRPAAVVRSDREPDLFEQLALAEAAEASLLRQVLIAAGAALALALLASLA